MEPPHGQATSHTGRSKDGKQSPSAAEADAGRSSLSGGLGGDGDAADAALGGNGSGSGSGGLAFSDDKDKDEDEDLVSLAALAAACSADLSLRQGDGPRPLDPRRKYLRIHVQAGSAFLSDMAPDQDDGGRSAASAASAGSTGLRTAARPRAETSFLVLHACFRGQRFRGIPVPASESPSFDAAFLLDLFPSLDAVPPGGGLRRLMASADPLQLAVTRIVATGPQAAAVGRGSAGAAEPTAAAAASAGLPAGLGELGGTAFRVELVSYVCVEWRRVLATGSASLTVELPAAGTAGEAGLSAGALACRLELVPRRAPASLADVSASGSRVPGMALPADVEARVRAIEQEQASASRRLFLAARRWWDGAVARRPDLRFRPVRIFAPDEGGVQRAVTSFVRPMRAGRLVESPRHAARLVALLPLRGHNPLGGTAGPGRRSEQRERAGAAAPGKGDGRLRAGHGRDGGAPAGGRGRGRSGAARRGSGAPGSPGSGAGGAGSGAAGGEGEFAGAGWDSESAWSPDAEFDEPDTAPWHSPFTVLAMRSGTAADHATLLCSLLRGFGLDAFVAVGTWVDARGVEGTHEWVVSLDDRSLDDAAGGAGEQEGGLVVRFWEPLTGERSAPDWPTADGRRFRTIACLFNEESLLANVQPTSSVSGCSWALRDEGKWLPFDQGAIGALAATLPPAPALCPPTVAEGPLAFALEQCLRAEALAWREEAALPEAPFDPRLEHSLAPALAAYESERLTGRPFGADDFRAAVRACVPPGHSFSAFPFQVGHASPARLAAFLRASAVAEGVVCSRREAVSLAVRVRVFAYAEDVLAVWVIVACRCA